MEINNWFFERKKVLLGALGLVGVFLAVVIALPGGQEPSYDGKSLSQWLDIWNAQHSSGRDEKSELEAEEAVRYIGKAAIPYLVRWMQGGNIEARLLVLAKPLPKWVSNKLYLAAQKKNRVMWRGQAGFRIIQHYGAAAIPQLTRMLDDDRRPQRRYLAVRSLANIGPTTLPYLLNTLTNRGCPAARRAGIAEVIAYMPLSGEDLATTEDELLICLKDEPRVMRAALEAFWVMGMHPQKLVPALTLVLANRSPQTRGSAAVGLSYFGTNARPAVPMLMRMLGDPDQNVRIRATNALKAIAPERLPENLQMH